MQEAGKLVQLPLLPAATWTVPVGGLCVMAEESNLTDTTCPTLGHNFPPPSSLDIVGIPLFVKVALPARGQGIPLILLQGKWLEAAGVSPGRCAGAVAGHREEEESALTHSLRLKLRHTDWATLF